MEFFNRNREMFRGFLKNIFDFYIDELFGCKCYSIIL